MEINQATSPHDSYTKRTTKMSTYEQTSKVELISSLFSLDLLVYDFPTQKCNQILRKNKRKCISKVKAKKKK